MDSAQTIDRPTLRRRALLHVWVVEGWNLLKGEGAQWASAAVKAEPIVPALGSNHEICQLMLVHQLPVAFNNWKADVGYTGGVVL